MPAGNASNTVFTTIPVGEDFYMSFSTNRFHRNISPQDFEYLNFKLYDARIIGRLDDPNPDALIIQYNNLPSDAYGDIPYSNPEGRPTFFKITPDSVSVFVLGEDLDNYEKTKTNNNAAVFRGEIYGYIEAVVTGEETKFARLSPLPVSASVSVIGELLAQDESWWDGYFFSEDLRSISVKTSVNSPTIGIISGGLPS